MIFVRFRIILATQPPKRARIHQHLLDPGFNRSLRSLLQEYKSTGEQRTCITDQQQKLRRYFSTTAVYWPKKAFEKDSWL